VCPGFAGAQYFGGQPSDSLGYCRGGSKMIIFAVLMDDSGLAFQGAGGAHSEVPICVCPWDLRGSI